MIEPDAVAWIAEQPADDDMLMASGRFSAYVDVGEATVDSIGGLGVTAILEWARKRATVVWIRLVDSGYFSAGERNPDPERVPPWQDGTEVVRRRPRGLEALDQREGDPPVLWDVRLHPPRDPEIADRYREAVDHDARVHPPPEAVDDGPVDGIRVFVRASTRGQAQRLADELDQVGRAAARGLDGRVAASPRFGPEVYPFAPGSGYVFG